MVTLIGYGILGGPTGNKNCFSSLFFSLASFWFGREVFQSQFHFQYHVSGVV